MRVGIDLSPLAYGNRTRGIGTYAENLVAALGAQDTTDEYLLLMTRGSEPYTMPPVHAPNVTLVKIAAPRLGRATPLVSHQLLLPFRARGLKLDVLHLIAVPHNPSTPGVPFWSYVPTVVTLFDVMPLRLSEMFLQRARHRRFYEFQLEACRRAATVITASQATARDLMHYAIAPRARIAVIPLAPPPLAVNISLSEAGRAMLQAAPFLLHVGGNEPQKDQRTVLRAFGLLCRNPAFRHCLILVGKHHLDDTPALEMTTRAARRILRLSDATRADLDALYAKCDAFVFPSLYEGFGLPLLEAMRAGAPVITANVSAMPEIGGDAAVFVEPQNAQALADAVRRVLDDERVRVKLSEAGERRAHGFTWARTAELTRQVYERAARRVP